jgi:hypothetical protein
MPNNGNGSIWDVNGTIYPWSAFDTANTISIPAVDPADNGHTITVIGLDENYDVQSEDFVVSSASAVTGNNVFKRVYRAFDQTATNTANINIQVNSTTVARISAGLAQTLMAVYTVPNGHTAYLTQGISSIQKNGYATMNFFVRYPEQNSFRVGHSFEISDTGKPYNYQFTCPLKIPAKADIDVRAIALNGPIRITAAFDMILIKDNLG